MHESAAPPTRDDRSWLHGVDLMLITFALGVEAAAGALFYDGVTGEGGERSRLWSPLMHILATILATLTARGGVAVPTFFTAFLMPPAGVIVRFVDLWLREAHRARESFPLFDDWRNANQSELPDPHGAPIQGPQAPPPKLPSVLLVAPLASLLEDPGIESGIKLAAVRRLTELPPEDSVALMKQALRNEEPTVRYYAAKLLGSLEDLFSQRIRRLSIGEDSPDDLPPMGELASAHLEYANSGVLDPGDARRHRGWGVEALFASVPMEGARPRHVQLALGHALLELGQTQEAISVAATLLERDRQDQTAYRLVLECCLRQGDYRAFRRWVRTLLEAQPDAAWAREIAERWNPSTSA